MHRSFVADEQKAAKVEKGLENVDIKSTQRIYGVVGRFSFFVHNFYLLLGSSVWRGPASLPASGFIERWESVTTFFNVFH